MIKMLSIIVPTYNSIKTIKRCLDSISSQVAKLDYEVIVVDDGSSDGTIDFLKSYIGNKKNFCLIEQQNSGAGVARNRGMEVAKGDYLAFVDSDDYLLQNALNIIEIELSENNLDILTFAYRYYREGGCVFKEMHDRDAEVYFNKKIKDKIFKFSDYPDLHGCSAYPWNKIYKRELLFDNQIKFSGTAVNNDIFVNIASLTKAKKIKFIRDILYVHTFGPDAVGSHLGDVFDERRLDALVVFKECEDFFTEEHLSESQKVPYYLLKLSLLKLIVPRTIGKVRREFVAYTENFLRSLSMEAIRVIMSKESVEPWMKNYIKSNVLIRRGNTQFSPNTTSSEQQLPLSVIVTINTIPYLDQCLQSIANQTLDAKFFEVILVNDKSTDGSTTICQRFCQRYSHFQMLVLPQHTSGGGIPFNRGMDLARGKYVGIVTGNDFIDSSMFEELLAKGVEADSDIVFSDFSVYCQGEGVSANSFDKNEWKGVVKESLNKEVKIEELRKKVLHLSPVFGRAIYKRTFLDEYNIRYPEGNLFYEDSLMHWQTALKAANFSFVDRCLLTLRLVQTEKTPEKLMSYISHGETIKNILRDEGLQDKYKTEYILWLLNQSSWIIPLLGDKKKTYMKWLKKTLSGITLADLKECRKAADQRKAVLIYNFFLVHGFHGTGDTIKRLIFELRK